MMEHLGGERAAIGAASADDRPSAPAAELAPIDATWRVTKPVVIVVAVLAIAGGLLHVVLSVSRSSSPPLNHPYLPAPPPTLAYAPAQTAWAEAMPPMTQGTRPLTPPQVRYCLSQEIRIQTANKAMNAASAEEAGRVRALLDDYNPRCGNYHYTPGILDSIKEEVEARRAMLESQGQALLRAPFEEKPPVAQGGVQLTASQVRYCLSQSIRLQGAGKVVNTASSDEASRFLALSDDYNPRCENYRSAPDVMQSIKAEVEARRAALEREGAALIRTPR